MVVKSREKQWIVREPGNPIYTRQLVQDLGIDEVLANLLVQRGIKNSDEVSRFFHVILAEFVTYDVAGVDSYDSLTHPVYYILRMCYHEDRRSGIVDLLQKLHDPVRCVRVQVSGRLVSDQNRRVVYYRSRDRNTLLFTGRQFLRISVALVSDPYELEDLRDSLLNRAAPHVEDLHSKSDVLEHRLLREQTEVLEHHADPSSQLRNHTIGKRCDFIVSYGDSAGISIYLLQDQFDESGLSRAGRTDQENKVTFVDVDARVFKSDVHTVIYLSYMIKSYHKNPA